MAQINAKVLAAIIAPPHLSVSGGAGAGERLSRSLASHVDITVASMLNGTGEVQPNEDEDGFHRVHVQTQLPPFLSSSAIPNRYKSLFYRSNIPEIIAEGDYDLVHIHNPMPALEMERVANVCRQRGIPYVVSAHGFNEVENGVRVYGFNSIQSMVWDRYMVKPVRRVVEGADAVFALTPADFPFVRACGFRGSELIAVPAGVPMPEPGDAETDFPALIRCGISPERMPGQITCMFLANHTPNKGLPVLFEAFAKLDIPYLLIVGGERRPGVDYDGAMSRCGPNQRIIVTGFLDDDQVDACFRRSDLFVFPTLAETFGIVVLQAMSQGLPVIASRVGGIPFFLKESCGQLVDPGDAEQLARTVEDLARDPERCQAMGECGRAEASKYTWDSAAETAAESYERVLKKAKSTSHAAPPPRKTPGDRVDLRARASDVGSKIRSSQHVQNAFHTLVDQGIVSLGNFVLQIVLARYLIPADYGYFALLMTLFFLVQHVHLSLVLYPLTLRVAGRETKDPSRLISTSIAVVVASSTLYALAIGSGLAVLGRGDLLWASAAFLIVWQTQDAMRQALMASLRHRDAVWGDAVCYLGQAAAIALLVHYNHLTLPNAFLAMAAACFAAMLVHGLVLRLSRPSLRLARENVSYFWHMGRWAFLNGSVIQVRTHMFTWALVGFGGTAAAGAYQAAMNIANFTNPVIFGMSNIIAPIAARTLKESGLSASWQAARTYFLIGAPLIFGYCAIVFAVPYVFLHLCYSADSPYLHLDTVVRLVVLAAAVNFLAEMTSTFLLGISRGNSALLMNSMAIAAAFLMLPLVGAWGVTGAAVALTVANSVRLIGSFFALRSATTEQAGSPMQHVRAPAE